VTDASGNGPRNGMNKKNTHSEAIQETGQLKQQGNRKTAAVMKFHVMVRLCK
jgi:hypothetical protein